MNKAQAIGEVISHGASRATVFTTGYSSRIAQSIDDRPNHFYMIGSMGLAASIGAGIAYASGLPVIVVDGDGSLAMNPGCLMTAASVPGLRLLHLVLNDGAYESTGGQQVPSQRTDFGLLATASGYARSARVDDIRGLTSVLRSGVEEAGPVLIDCTLTGETALGPPPRIELDLPVLCARFSRHLREALNGS